MLLWICGVSGSGKTTLGKALYARLKPSMPALFLLDGDDFRSAMGGDAGYSPDERKRNALRIARMCHLIENQGIHVITCAVTISPEAQELNRRQCKDYREIYIRVSKETLLRRDPKGLYHKCLNGELHDLPGFDTAYSPPREPHLVLDNDEDLPNRDGQVAKVLAALQGVLGSQGSARVTAGR
jgi:adenylylsulfate kinase